MNKQRGKPYEVEELVDHHFHRPLAAPLVARLNHTRLTPDQVTWLSGIVGVISGLCLLAASELPWLRALAAGLLLVSVVLDCCDGQLARLRGTSSTTGALLDGAVDFVVGTVVFVAATVVAAHDLGHAAVYALGTVAGVSGAIQSWLYDDAKNRYVAATGFSVAEREHDLDRVAALRAEARRDRRWLDVVLLATYARFTRTQAAAMGRTTPADQEQQRPSRLAMRAWSWLGSGSHFALFYIAVALSALWPPALLVLFLIFAVPMNLVLAVLLVQARRQARS